MDNQCETLIPCRLEYVPLLFHPTNNSQLESMIGFNASIYNNAIDYL